MSTAPLPAWPLTVAGLPPALPDPGGLPTAVDAADCPLARLLARVQDGDEVAFSELHAQTWRRLHQAANRILRSPELVEDVVQDTYLLIWRHRHRFQPGLGSAMGWMTAIARRRAIDRVRNLTTTQNLHTRYATDPTRSADADHQTTVTDAVVAETVVRQALDTLTPTQREALLLTYWDGRTAAQAAQLLGIPVPTLKSRLHSATSRLRRLDLHAYQLA